jgi:polyisoprenoid-binding protein YceI
MVRLYIIYRITLLVLAALLLAACGPAAAPAPQPQAPPTATAAAPVAPGPTAAAAPGPAAGAVRTFVIVPGESKASYVVDEEFFADALSKYNIAAGRGKTIGSTQEIAGQLQLDLTNLAAPLGDNRFTVQMNTLSSDQALRDGWLRTSGPRFNQFPEAEFVATGVADAPASYTEGQEVSFLLLGDLTVRNITQPVVFDVTATLQGDTITGKAIARALLSDFGIDPPNFANTLVVGNEFTIEVDITAREQ